MEQTDTLSRIYDDETLRVALRRLMELDSRFEGLFAAHDLSISDVPLRARPPTLETLCEIVTSQVVTRQVADLLWGRLSAHIDMDNSSAILRATDDAFLAAGLTRAKMRAMRGLAAAVDNRSLELPALPAMDADEAVAHLTQVKGIGPWTAHIYLLFCVGHLDVFPAGDVALQSMLQAVLHLQERPKAREAAHLAKPWAPLRGVAARALYAAYGAKRAGAGQPI
ncbi:MAG: DNA-3-methyladenine glycosylase 2 family protein [Pseudomonadota bacterium]